MVPQKTSGIPVQYERIRNQIEAGLSTLQEHAFEHVFRHPEAGLDDDGRTIWKGIVIEREPVKQTIFNPRREIGVRAFISILP